LLRLQLWLSLQALSNNPGVAAAVLVGAVNVAVPAEEASAAPAAQVETW